MLKQFLLITLVAIITTNLIAQENSSKFDYKLGTGISIMGSGDLFVLSFENELNYKLTNYISTSLGIGIGRSVQTIDRNNNYLLGGLNLFVSPFRNDKKNNFKFGLGYTLINESVTYKVYITNPNNVWPIHNYYSNVLNCFNVIIEDEKKITSKYLIGGKLFMTAGIKEGGVLIGGMLKLGVIL